MEVDVLTQSMININNLAFLAHQIEQELFSKKGPNGKQILTKKALCGLLGNKYYFQMPIRSLI